MPNIATLPDGTEIEVPTAEEAEAKATAEAASAKELEDLRKQVEENGNEDLHTLRNSHKEKKKMLKSLEEQGMMLDEEGKVIKKPEAPTTESMQEIANKAVIAQSVKMEKSKVFAQYSKEDAEKLEAAFDTVSGNQTVGVEDVARFAAAAATLAQVSLPQTMSPEQRANMVSGRPPGQGGEPKVSKGAAEMGAQFGLSEADIEAGGDVTKHTTNVSK